MRFRLDIALERALLGALLAMLPCLQERLAQGLWEVDWRKCLAMGIAGFIGGLLVDFGIYKTKERENGA